MWRLLLARVLLCEDLWLAATEVTRPAVCGYRIVTEMCTSFMAYAHIIACTQTAFQNWMSLPGKSSNRYRY